MVRSLGRVRTGGLERSIERALPGREGLSRMAAPPAISGMELMSEVTTGQAQAIASRIGRPNVSLNEG